MRNRLSRPPASSACLSLFAALLLALPALSETAPTPTWVRVQDGTEHLFDSAAAIATDGDGNVYVTGTADEDYLTVKYQPNGALAWTARYNGPGNNLDSPAGVVVDTDGGVYVTGGSYGGSTQAGGTDFDITTIKYDALGNEVWVRRHNGSGNREDSARAIMMAPEGDIVVAGYGWQTGTAYDYVTLRYAADGSLVWSLRYDHIGSSDRATGLAIDPLGNILVTGESWGGTTQFDYATVKYSPNGSSQWARRYNGPQNGADSAQAVCAGADGSVWVTGSSASPTNTDIATLRYSSDGAVAWSSRFNGQGNGPDAGVAIAADSAGNAYVAGTTWSSPSGRDYLTAKYGPNGSLLWSASFNGSGGQDDRPSAVGTDAAGNVYVTGQAGFGSDTTTFATLKYASNGDALWTARYEGPAGPAGAAGMVVMPDGELQITGYTWTSAGGQDFATLRYPAPPPPAPAAPTNLTATLDGTHVALTWEHPGGSNLSGFILERRTGAGSYSVLATPAAAARAQTDTTTTSGNQYTYRVRATGVGGDSDPSNIQTISIPPAGLPGKLVVGKKVNVGTVKVGKSKTKKLVIKNTGKGSLSGNISLGSGSFTLTGGGSFSLLPRKTLSVLITYAPLQTETMTGSLVIQSNDPVRPLVNVAISAKAR